MKYYFHGSDVPGITQLEARSKLHGTGENVAYLTDCLPYALFYIWDAGHNGYSGKHVTGWVRDGAAFYEEQFPDQLKTFYRGVSGYLYRIAETPDVKPMAGRDNLFYCPCAVPVYEAERIPDVYEALLQYEAAGKLTVLRYNDQTPERQNELTDLIATALIQANFFEDDPEHRAFMKKHFSKAWAAVEQKR